MRPYSPKVMIDWTVFDSLSNPIILGEDETSAASQLIDGGTFAELRGFCVRQNISPVGSRAQVIERIELWMDFWARLPETVKAISVPKLLDGIWDLTEWFNYARGTDLPPIEEDWIRGRKKARIDKAMRKKNDIKR